MSNFTTSNNTFIMPVSTTTTGIVITDNTSNWGYETSNGTYGWGSNTIGGSYNGIFDINPVPDLLKDLVANIRALSKEKLSVVGMTFKRSLKRYKTLDKAMNIIRDIGLLHNFTTLQEIIWNELEFKLESKNYNIRDAIWDVMVATIAKNDLTEKEFMTLSFPYGITVISER